MGRGGIGGGGGRPSSSHSSHSRSFSSHRPGSSFGGSGGRGDISSRPSTSSGSSGGFNFGRAFSSSPPPQRRPVLPSPPRLPRHYGAPPPPPPRRHYGAPPPPSLGPVYRSSFSFGKLMAIVATIICLFIFVSVFPMMISCVGGCVSTGVNGNSYSAAKHQGLAKTKIEPLAAYQTNCVFDEDDWFVDPYQVGKDLKGFYDRTGIQPYVLIKAYDASIVSDAQRDAFAEKWYDEHIDNEGALLFIYFAERSNDAVGMAILKGGASTKTFMDDLAMDVFWDVYDSNYFNTDLDSEEFILNTFNETADICLSSRTVTTTQETGAFAFLGKFIPVVLIILAVIVVAIILVSVVCARNKHNREKAEETARILNTPIEKLGDNGDDLVDKYNKE